MPGFLIPLLVFGAGFLVLAGVIWYIYSRVVGKIKKIARMGFGTDKLEDILKQQELLDDEPKSVSGATPIYLPKLQADFPELNWAEMVKTAEDHLKKYLSDRKFSQILVHKSALNDYKKSRGTCYATIQMAVQYLDESEKKHQSRYNVEMAYVQDASVTGYKKSYSVTCPSCGAPITNLGMKVCEYCGSSIIPVNLNVWSLNSVKEV